MIPCFGRNTGHLALDGAKTRQNTALATEKNDGHPSIPAPPERGSAACTLRTGGPADDLAARPPRHSDRQAANKGLGFDLSGLSLSLSLT